jgi:transcriptional regulator with XRE-family HTH domain
MFDPSLVGPRIAEARRERNLTQPELADLLNLSLRSLQGYEAGAIIPFKHLPRIAAVLGKPQEWFVLSSNGNGAGP